MYRANQRQKEKTPNKTGNHVKCVQLHRDETKQNNTQIFKAQCKQMEKTLNKMIETPANVNDQKEESELARHRWKMVSVYELTNEWQPNTMAHERN